MVLINGGEIAWEDVLQNVKGWSVLASVLREEATDQRAEELIASGLVQAIDLSAGADTLARIIEKIFSAQE